MSKELFIELAEELGRDPTDDEMTDAEAKRIDEAHERRIQEVMQCKSHVLIHPS